MICVDHGAADGVEPTVAASKLSQKMRPGRDAQAFAAPPEPPPPLAPPRPAPPPVPSRPPVPPCRRCHRARRIRLPSRRYLLPRHRHCPRSPRGPRHPCRRLRRTHPRHPRRRRCRFPPRLQRHRPGHRPLRLLRRRYRPRLPVRHRRSRRARFQLARDRAVSRAFRAHDSAGIHPIAVGTLRRFSASERRTEFGTAAASRTPRASYGYLCSLTDHDHQSRGRGHHSPVRQPRWRLLVPACS